MITEFKNYKKRISKSRCKIYYLNLREITIQKWCKINIILIKIKYINLPLLYITWSHRKSFTKQ